MAIALPCFWTFDCHQTIFHSWWIVWVVILAKLRHCNYSCCWHNPIMALTDFLSPQTYSWSTSCLKMSTLYSVQFSSVQFSRSVLSDSLQHPWIAARQASPAITISRSSLRLTSIESVMPSSHLILGYPLVLLPPIPPSIRVYSNESTLCMRWPKYWSFSFSIIPSKEIPGLIFSMDWLDLLAVQGTLKSLLQHHSSKASIL